MISYDLIKKEKVGTYFMFKKKEGMNPPSLLKIYRHTWKSRHNHFLRHLDLRFEEERRPTVNELANHRFVLQQINEWKIYHLSLQMEQELTDRLAPLQKRLELMSAHSRVKFFK